MKYKQFNRKKNEINEINDTIKIGAHPSQNTPTNTRISIKEEKKIDSR